MPQAERSTRLSTFQCQELSGSAPCWQQSTTTCVCQIRIFSAAASATFAVLIMQHCACPCPEACTSTDGTNHAEQSALRKHVLSRGPIDLCAVASLPVRGRMGRCLTLSGTVGDDDHRVTARCGVAKCVLCLQADRHGLADDEGRRDTDQRRVRRAAGCWDDGERPRGAFDMRAAVGDRHRVCADLERRVPGRKLASRGVSRRLPVDVDVLCAQIGGQTTTKLG